MIDSQAAVPAVTHRELLRAHPSGLGEWLAPGRVRASAGFVVLSIAFGFGLYGFSVGVWRSAAMGGFVAVKLPALVFLVLVLNGLLNTMLGLLLGSGLGLVRTLLCQGMSFAVAGLLLGALSPITLLMALDSPEPESAGAETAHAINLVVHTLLVGAAGIHSAGGLGDCGPFPDLDS